MLNKSFFLGGLVLAAGAQGACYFSLHASKSAVTGHYELMDFPKAVCANLGHASAVQTVRLFINCNKKGLTTYSSAHFRLGVLIVLLRLAHIVLHLYMAIA